MAEAQTKPAPVGAQKAAPAPGASADPKAAKPAKEKAPPKEKTFAGHKGTAIITMGKNKEGKPYGADNNPKRVNTACHARFAKYVDGKTIAETLAIPGGPVAGDLAFDSAPTRAYIVIKDV